VNVVGRRAGNSSGEVVVLAARDSDSPPDATGSAADTAALIELARVLGGRAPRKTVVLASVDGSARGDAGVRRLMTKLEDRDLVDAVVVIDELGARTSRGPLVVTTSNDHRRGNLGLERTAQSSLRAELGSVPAAGGFLSQIPRMALPIGVGGQGVLIADDIDTVRVSGSGELDAPPAKALDDERYSALGRSVLRLFSALDAGGRPEHGPNTYLTASTKLMPGWAITLLVATLLLPPLVASIDAFARARRKRQAVARWFGWIGAGVGAALVALVVAVLYAATGAVPDPPPAPLQPGTVHVDGAAAAGIALTLLVGALAWFFGQRLVAHRLELMERPGDGAGVAIALSLTLFGVAVFALNPFAALVLLPAVHAWTLASLTRVGRGWALGLVAAGLVPLALLALFYLFRFDLGPLDGAWYWFLLVTGDQAGLVATLLGTVLIGLFLAVLALAIARQNAPPSREAARRDSRPRQAVFGPGGYAGPGALGGTSSRSR
jgi:predicted anti-sigma-YlaC factor YlaD